MVVVKDGHIVSEVDKQRYHSDRKLWTNCRAAPLNLVVIFASDSDQAAAMRLQHMHALIEAAASSSADSPS